MGRSGGQVGQPAIPLISDNKDHLVELQLNGDPAKQYQVGGKGRDGVHQPPVDQYR